MEDNARKMRVQIHKGEVKQDIVKRERTCQDTGIK